MQRSLANIQLVRFAAACAVVLCHSVGIYLTAGGTPALADVARLGALGVPVFFVISGFVIYGAALRAAGPVDFLLRRLQRIYPPLWAAVGLLLLVTWCCGGDWPTQTQLFNSLTLLTLDPDGNGNALFVAWTLSYEMLFYMAAALLLWLPPAQRQRAALLAALTYLVLTYGGWAWVPPLLGNPVVFSFVFGVLAARTKVPQQMRLPLLALGWGCGATDCGRR